MDARSLQLLELPSIIERLARECSTSLGIELAQALTPSTRMDETTERLADTTEAMSFLNMRRFPSVGAITDVRALTKRAEASGVLTAGELQQIADTLTGLRKLNEALTAPEARDKQRLLTRAWRLKPQLELEHQIRAAVETDSSALGSRQGSFEAAVKDEATEDLKRIRRAIRSLGEQVQVRLRRLISHTSFQKKLQEPIFTLRDERYVVPVRSEHRHEVKGIVHDRSASGGTFFIEPQEIVDLNNEVREFKLDERDEVERILRKLSREVGRHREAIEDSLRAAAELDLMFAKARLAQRMRATCPSLRDDGIVDLRQARHPLLQGETDRATGRGGDGQTFGDTSLGPLVAQSPSPVVPIDLRLGEDFDALFITGPNTGGKTVTLKTLGLLTLMAQCGLQVPAAEGARLTVFERVYADIGDEQSIEQSLSTFSSHMRRIVKFLRKADARTLVLIDEIGAGTDPDEGAALGKALVRALLQRGAKVLVTTHYGELKLFAAAEPRVENASVEFDANTLRPTYRLRIGIPGSSNAFSIAQRLGMPWNLIRRARHFLRRDRLQAAKVIRQLEHSQQELERESELAAQAREDAELLRGEYDERVAAASGERHRILVEAREEAMRLLKHVRAEADEVMRRLRSQQRESKDTEAARAQLKQIAEVVREFAREESPRELANQHDDDQRIEAALTVGGAVWIGSLKRHGVLLSAPDARDRVSVRVGMAAVELDAHEVTAASGPPEPSTSSVAIHASPGYVPSELHLRGMTIAEAMPLLDKYLDNAMLAQVECVRVVHGKGTGTIRRAVHEVLKKHPGVKSFHLAEPHEGADGVTIVHL